MRFYITFLLLLILATWTQSIGQVKIFKKGGGTASSYVVTNQPDGVTIVSDINNKLKLANPFTQSQKFAPIGASNITMDISDSGLVVKGDQVPPVYIYNRANKTDVLATVLQLYTETKNDSAGNVGLGAGITFYTNGNDAYYGYSVGGMWTLGQLAWTISSPPSLGSIKSQFDIIGKTADGVNTERWYRFRQDGIFPLDTYVAGDDYTGADIARDLGSSTFQWNNTYTDTMTVIEDYVGNNTIGTEDIKNGTITGSDIASETITASDILDGTITGADIADGTITGNDIWDATVIGADIQDGSLSGADLATNTIDSSRYGIGSVTSKRILDNTIQSVDIKNGTIQSIDILNGTILGDDISTNTIGFSQMKSADKKFAVTYLGNHIFNSNLSTGTWSMLGNKVACSITGYGYFDLPSIPYTFMNNNVVIDSIYFTVSGTNPSDQVSYNLGYITGAGIIMSFSGVPAVVGASTMKIKYDVNENMVEDRAYHIRIYANVTGSISIYNITVIYRVQ